MLESDQDRTEDVEHSAGRKDHQQDGEDAGPVRLLQRSLGSSQFN
jgi:hypothetical protein